MERENGRNLLFRLFFRAACSAGGTNYLVFDYRLGRENNGRPFGPRFPGIPASHQNVCSGVRSGQVTGRRVRARVCGSDCMSLSVTLASACPLGGHRKTAFACRAARARTQDAAATVPVPFHGVPNGPKLPWGRSERGRTSVQRALIKLWPAFFSPSLPPSPVI